MSARDEQTLREIAHKLSVEPGALEHLGLHFAASIPEPGHGRYKK